MLHLSLSGRLAVLGVVFGASLAWLYILVNLLVPTIGNELELGFPSNLSELKRISSLLSLFATSHPVYVLTLFSSAYLFKQTFAIPGSFFINILGGAIYGIWWGFPLCCLLTATGATLCFLLSRMLGSQELVERHFPRQLATLRAKLPSPDSPQLLQMLISLRLFPMSPNWFLNIASPVLRIPLGQFYLSVLVGLMPYNFICVQAGSILGELRSLDSVLNLRTLATFATIAAAFAGPLVWRRFRSPAPRVKTN